MFDTCDGLSCNPTCMWQVLPGGRAETDGSFVWAIVLSVLVSAFVVLGSGERHRHDDCLLMTLATLEVHRVNVFGMVSKYVRSRRSHPNFVLETIKNVQPDEKFHTTHAITRFSRE